MSEHSTPEERTEMPTERRMSMLRKEGQLHSSNEVTQVATLLAGFLMLFATWDWLVTDIEFILIRSFKMIATIDQFTPQLLYDGMIGLIRILAPDLLAIMLVVAVVAILSIMLQTKWNVREKLFKFRFDMLNPIQGVKKIFSLNQVVQTLKAILKLALILPIGYFGLKSFAPAMVMLMHTTVNEVMAFTGMAISKLFWRIMYILIALAIFDYFWSKYQWLRQNKMTKEEVKDERKAVEGDETTKRKIIAKGLQRIMQRIQSSVPQADVVITNPTHYAVALKYDRETMSAPQVVAKGKGFLAKRIREIAKEHGVPVLERKLLARALYASTEVGSEIPYDLFKAVAEVLAYVYKLKNPYAYARTGG
ncbi:MAG: flagellar biosynthesis protein FlhB [Candidatus Dadabacteria bacterium]|nr:MAG: flagellar biosynthesis protein FlhB [Candidatus Dadabacteria bacterium]